MTIDFKGLGLSEPLLRALEERGHDAPTPIQAQAIPTLLEGRDLLGIAQTGTGKTGAFALPLLHRLNASQRKRRNRAPRALILAPTRELAIQIGDEIRAYGKRLPIKSFVIFGGVGQRPQTQALDRGLDILVATPGRLLDLMGQKRLTLEDVDTVILDEADRMFDMGFIRDVRKITAALPKARQSLLFSATMPDEIMHLANEILHKPERVEIAPQSTPVERIKQTLRHVAKPDKPAMLAELLADPAFERVIVFSRTKHGADRIAKRLNKDGVRADALHGNKTQGARQKALAAFKSGEARVLVATDIAARGIDVDGVTHVVNFDLPVEPESYVHRIGRTARAGATGEAVAFCDPEERGALRAIERAIGMKLDVVGDAPPEDEALAGKPRRRRGGGGGGQGGPKRRPSPSRADLDGGADPAPRRRGPRPSQAGGAETGPDAKPARKRRRNRRSGGPRSNGPRSDGGRQGGGRGDGQGGRAAS
ncbi:MAG: DEAD/DEAH box helicase [Pseudomonadota bacterium]